MAEIHPFLDANGRTRNIVLETELCRLGGHPLLLHDTGWFVYNQPSQAALELCLLRGWCARGGAATHTLRSYHAHTLSVLL